MSASIKPMRLKKAKTRVKKARRIIETTDFFKVPIVTPV